MYINACLQQISKGKKTFPTDEERYDYAVSLLNEGHYEDAKDALQADHRRERKTPTTPSMDWPWLASMTGDAQHCLEHLTEAIRLNAKNRIQARADSDFQDMADDPRFTELLYPEV